MKITAISDVHVKLPHDEADKLLCRFLDHELTRSADYVALLGDIFDLMCGPHKAYLEDYGHIFNRLNELKNSGKKILFFEGNHDVHLKKLFYMYWNNYEIVPHQEALTLKVDDKIYYLSHGDEHEVDNISYQKYKSLIISQPLRFVAEFMMPYSLLNFLGRRASKLSRKKGNKIFDSNKVKERFRKGVEITTKGRYHFVLGGHSHVQDIYKMENAESVYINNGYALNTKTFISIVDHQVKFESLV